MKRSKKLLIVTAVRNGASVHQRARCSIIQIPTIIRSCRSQPRRRRRRSPSKSTSRQRLARCACDTSKAKRWKRRSPGRKPNAKASCEAEAGFRRGGPSDCGRCGGQIMNMQGRLFGDNNFRKNLSRQFRAMVPTLPATTSTTSAVHQLKFPQGR